MRSKLPTGVSINFCSQNITSCYHCKILISRRITSSLLWTATTICWCACCNCRWEGNICWIQCSVLMLSVPLTARVLWMPHAAQTETMCCGLRIKTVNHRTKINKKWKCIGCFERVSFRQTIQVKLTPDIRYVTTYDACTMHFLHCVCIVCIEAVSLPSLLFSTWLLMLWIAFSQKACMPIAWSCHLNK